MPGIFVSDYSRLMISKDFLGRNTKPIYRFWSRIGGDGRDRTGDLHVANVALSQLSYTPTIC